MTIIDTHSHIYDECFDKDIDSIIERAKLAGVINVLLPNVDEESIPLLTKLTESYPGYCLPMMGLHPTSVTKNWQGQLQTIKKLFSTHKYIGVGEIGIDLYWDTSLADEQKVAFEEQLRWSIEYDLPVSIHTRNAIMESIQCIRNAGAENLKGVFHSFGGTKEELDSILELKNFYIGINGTVTYKNSTLPVVLQNTTLNHIIIETDAPYLPPVPYRGKRNEPSYTTYIVEKLAEVFHTEKEAVGKITTENAKKLYQI